MQAICWATHSRDNLVHQHVTLAMVYGKQGQYQKAYDCYTKAHELSPERPAPVLGLGLASRDLKRYEECLKWCDEYDKLSNDHHLDNARRDAQAAL